MKSRLWTKREIALLRKHYGRVPMPELMTLLGRSEYGIRQAAKKLGLRHPIHWSEHDLAILRRDYGKVPGPELAKRLGIPIKRLHGAAKHYGLVNPNFIWTEDCLEKLRQWHAQGWSDAEIAAELGCDRHGVGKKRRKLKLKRWYGRADSVWHQRFRDRARKKTAEQLEKAGLESLGKLRAATYRQYARDGGWPEDLRPREVQILNALAVHGPMTKQEIARAIGADPEKRNSVHGGLNLLNGNGPGGSYTANLLRAGLICYLHRSQASGKQGVGRIPGLYMLTATALAMIEKHLKSKAEEQGS